MKTRINKVAAALKENALDALLVLQPENRYYLSGFTGDTGALLITAGTSFLITDFRYTQQAKEQSPHLEIKKMETTLAEALVELISRLGLHVLGFESDYISYKFYDTLQEKLQQVSLRPVEGIVEQFRLVKNKSELATIERAMGLLDEGFEHICNLIKPGVTEREIALELEMFMRRRGAERIAFPFIVASGPRAALPHGEASAKTINHGDIITIDFGVVVDNYNSDMTRTVSLGSPGALIRQIYDIVLEAQLAGLAAVKAGVAASSVDKAARDIIASHGYGEYFGHSTGHGVGLAVHEGPRLSMRDDTILQEGMVVTIEPGIYLPGTGGVRIEDSVVVEKYGCRRLTKSPKDRLIEL
ncbi:M24 family metallopeptidase [Desulfallas thermosapovorans]|uniref:Xaa-Pro aminopeptidase/Xaa-Pro dipeptidase n=1 Tax=Desulfallas thermosapovorans DSM 6562 TaxID=1121431 RepID=A0A5S4ZRU9_9FIRM|nr:Xaa-Pro peptidase family protein [Desulfallas thermosapovorans]TYO95644.1 Xaa-Pro aminopeptidase/Xaa-Pro dipeptidase [Desulfallas thermosapovorans DSM 6562]